MGKEIKISVAAETRGVASEIRKGVQEPLEDVERKFSEVARASDRAADQIGEGLGDEVKDGAREAERALEQLEDQFDQTRKAAKEAGDAGSRIGDDVRRGTREAGEGLDELREESVDTAREAAASFDGSADSIADAFQEVAANALQGFGPAGLAAGLAIAAGIGIGISALQSAADDANAAGEAVADLAGEILDAGGSIDQVDLGARIREWALEIADSREWWEVWQERATTNMDRVEEAAGKTGIAVADMLAAMSGTDAAAAARVVGELDRQISDLQARIEVARQTKSPFLGDLNEELGQLESYRSAIQQQSGVTEQAIASAGGLQMALEQLGYAEAVATEAADARAAAIESLEDELGSAIGSWQDYEDAETGALDPAAFLAGIAERNAAMTNYGANIEAIKGQVSPETLQAVLDAGLDFAPMLQSIIDSGLVGEMDTQFSAAATAAQTAADKISGTAVSPIQVPLRADAQPAETDLQAWLANVQAQQTTVPVAADTAPAQQAVDNWANLTNYTQPQASVSASTSPAADAFLAWVDQVTSSTTTAPVSGNTVQAATAFSSFQALVGGSTSTAAVEADTAPADDRVSSWLARPREARIIANVDNNSLWAADGELESLTRTRYGRIVVTVDQVPGSRVAI